jgi:hypothetical protein
MLDCFSSARSIFAGDSPKPSPTLSTVSCDPDCTEQLQLEESARLSSDADQSRHERHVSVLRLLQRRDRELADTFEDLRRSTEMRQLALIPSQELLSEEEFGRFSSETGVAVPILLGV